MTSNQEAVATASVLNFEDLSTAQKQKFHYAQSIYNNSLTTMKFVSFVESKGVNSFKSATDKISALLKADYKQQQFHDALYDAFDLGKPHTSDDIISTGGQVMRDLDIPMYLSSIKRNCEHDFFSLFLYKTVTEETVVDNVVKKKIVGYIPMFRLKPEE